MNLPWPSFGRRLILQTIALWWCSYFAWPEETSIIAWSRVSTVPRNLSIPLTFPCLSEHKEVHEYPKGSGWRANSCLRVRDLEGWCLPSVCGLDWTISEVLLSSEHVDPALWYGEPDGDVLARNWSHLSPRRPRHEDVCPYLNLFQNFAKNQASTHWRPFVFKQNKFSSKDNNSMLFHHANLCAEELLAYVVRFFFHYLQIKTRWALHPWDQHV